MPSTLALALSYFLNSSTSVCDRPQHQLVMRATGRVAIGDPFVPFDFIASFLYIGTACGDSVFCCSGTASGDPCHFKSPHHFCGNRCVFLSLSGPLCASLCFSEALWASLGLSGPLWASLGLSGPLWASLGLSGSLWGSLHNKHKTLHNRQAQRGPERHREAERGYIEQACRALGRGLPTNKNPGFQDQNST